MHIYSQIFNVNCPTESLPWNCLNLIFTEITKNNKRKGDKIMKSYFMLSIINVINNRKTKLLHKKTNTPPKGKRQAKQVPKHIICNSNVR